MGSVREIGRYQVERVLGRGAQGTVYLAQDPHLGRAVAIKAISTRDPARLNALLGEARIVSRLNHPNIVTLFDAVEVEGAHYLIFEYVPGHTLAQLVR